MSAAARRNFARRYIAEGIDTAESYANWNWNPDLSRNLKNVTFCVWIRADKVWLFKQLRP